MKLLYTVIKKLTPKLASMVTGGACHAINGTITIDFCPDNCKIVRKK